MYDVIIKNGVIIDGTRKPRYQADVAIQGEQIVQIGDLSEAQAAQIIDASGQCVAPGFIDVHNHSDAWVLRKTHLTPKTTQGFTTEVIMADGISYAPVNPHTVHDWIFYLRSLNGLRLDEYRGWQTLGEFTALLDRQNYQNVMTHVPYANVRSMLCGFGRARPDDYQMQEMLAIIREGMEAGAVGLSTGLDYICECFADTAEITAACRGIAPEGGLYVTHIRYKQGILRGVQEAVEIGKLAGVPVHISHLKTAFPQEAEALLKYIDEVAVNEVDFSFETYPYVASSTMLNYYLPYEIWEQGAIAAQQHLKDQNLRTKVALRLQALDLTQLFIGWLPGRDQAQYQGMSIATYAAQTGQNPADAVCNLLIESGMATLMVLNPGDDTLIDPFLAHPRCMIGSDAIFFADGHVHPRAYGTATRVIGPCVRDRKVFSLEDAVYKLSGYSAERFGLKNRGVIKEGYAADIVIFDADTVTDLATLENPHQPSTGISHVLVNGTAIITDGQPLTLPDDRLPGRYLKFKQ